MVNPLLAVGWHHPPEGLAEHQAKVGPANEVIHRAIAEVLEPDRDRFRLPVSEVARLLRLWVFTGSQPIITDNQPISAEIIATVLLDGIRHDPAPEEP